MDEYQGEERRRQDRDHDLLVEMHTMLKGIEKNYDQHVKDDDVHFSRLYSMTGKLKWYVAVGAGAVAALEIFKDKVLGK